MATADPKNVAALLNRAVANFHRRRPKDMIVDATAVIDIRKDIPDAHLLRALGNLMSGEPARTAAITTRPLLQVSARKPLRLGTRSFIAIDRRVSQSPAGLRRRLSRLPIRRIAFTNKNRRGPKGPRLFVCRQSFTRRPRY
ncbi:MAG: hypothetical protein QM775_13335 [Pirellulales bacterium]